MTLEINLFCCIQKIELMLISTFISFRKEKNTCVLWFSFIHTFCLKAFSNIYSPKSFKHLFSSKVITMASIFNFAFYCFISMDSKCLPHRETILFYSDLFRLRYIFLESTEYNNLGNRTCTTPTATLLI